MSLRPEISQLLTQIQASGMKPFHQSSISEVRTAISSFRNMQKPIEHVAKTTDIEYQEHTWLRIYQPAILQASEQRLPVLVYYHGGGFVAGDLDVVDETCHALAHLTTHIVVSVDYRLAPEHPFPAAHLDARTGLQWVVEHIENYSGDLSHIRLIGDSAGGNLATTTALWAKTKGIHVDKQVLIYPVIQPEMDSPSRHPENAYLISQEDMNWFWMHYAIQDGHEVNYSPLQFDHLKEAPPTLILSTEYEVARDDAEYYGKCLIENGVTTTFKRILGGVHGIFWLSAIVPEHEVMRQEIKAFLAQ